MGISIVTLNFNGSEDIAKLLKSLEDQTDKDFQIIMVDNASEEADFANLQIAITTLNVVSPQVVRNSENLGFSGGNNVGIRHALNPSTRTSTVSLVSNGSGQEMGSDWIVFLNNDTWVGKNFIERLRGILGFKNGVVGIPMIEGDPAPNLSADRHSPVGKEGRIWCGASRVAYCGKIQWLKPTLPHITTLNVVSPQVIHKNNNNDIQCRYYAIGGAMAIHRGVFEKIGLLDEKYFLYFEDADFSLRARKAGFDISIVENLNVHHRVSSSTKKLGSPLLLRYHYRNALYFNLKNGPWYIKLIVWPWSWFIIIKQLVKMASRINTSQSKAILNGVVDFYFNKVGKIKAGMETSNV